MTRCAWPPGFDGALGTWLLILGASRGAAIMFIAIIAATTASIIYFTASGDGLAFGTVAAAAILTHGNAWALSLVPGITFALSNRWYLLRRLGFWLAPVPVVVTCVPWNVFWPGEIDVRGGSVTSLFVDAAPGYVWFVYLGVRLPVFIFLLIGARETIIRVKPWTEVAPEWAALAGLAIATFILHPAGTG